MNRWAEAFNRSALSRFLNGPAGRVFRFVGGIIFVVIGCVDRETLLGILSIAWGLLAMSAGGFDVCYFSVVLGGPFSGKKIRSQFHSGERTGGAA